MKKKTKKDRRGNFVRNILESNEREKHKKNMQNKKANARRSNWRKQKKICGEEMSIDSKRNVQAGAGIQVNLDGFRRNR